MNDTYPDFKIIKRSLDYKKYLKYILITSSLFFYTTVIILMNPLNIPLFDNTKYVPINNGEYIQNELTVPRYDSGILVFDYSFTLFDAEYHENSTIQVNFHPTELITFYSMQRSSSHLVNGESVTVNNWDIYSEIVYTLEEAIEQFKDLSSFVDTELNTIEFTEYTETEIITMLYDLNIGFIIYHAIERSENAPIQYSINRLIELELTTEDRTT